jgi:hypothetical protein
MENSQSLIQLIRGSKNRTKGIIVAVKTPDNVVGIGWSLCMKKDRFNKMMGMHIAEGRAIKNATERVVVGYPPHSIALTLEKFYDRCNKYFKEELVYPESFYLDKS